MLGNDLVALLMMSKELSQYSMDMELATNYRINHKKFNYSYYIRLIQKVASDKGDVEEIEILYPNGLK